MKSGEKLALFFAFDGKKFAITTESIIEVVPYMNLRHIPKTAEYVAGMINYRGRMAPVLDACLLLGNRKSRKKISTRIIIMNYPDSENPVGLLGLIAEDVLQTGSIDLDEAQPMGYEAPEAKYLGDMQADKDGGVQLLRIDQLLTEDIRERLYRDLE